MNRVQFRGWGDGKKGHLMARGWGARVRVLGALVGRGVGGGDGEGAVVEGPPLRRPARGGGHWGGARVHGVFLARTIGNRERGVRGENGRWLWPCVHITHVFALVHPIKRYGWGRL